MAIAIIARPLPALETSLLGPNDWDIVKDELEGDLDIGRLDFRFCPRTARDGVDTPQADAGSRGFVPGHPWNISPRQMLARNRQAEAIGSIGLAKILLDAQDKGNDIIPRELRNKNYIVLPRTIVHSFDGYDWFPYLDSKNGEWKLFLTMGGDYEFICRARFIRTLRC
jgi:hypothetical protein